MAVLRVDHPLQNRSIVRTLFNTTIFDNIVYGLEEAKASRCEPGNLQALVEDAATKANAHDFISNSPEGYQTLVGEKGTQLLGGQRQRLAFSLLFCTDSKKQNIVKPYPQFVIHDSRDISPVNTDDFIQLKYS